MNTNNALFRFVLGIVFTYLMTACSFSEIIGGYATDFTDYGAGARVLALGGAGRTLIDDSSAGYYNSALLPEMIDINFTGMTTTLMDVTKYNYFGMSLPIGEKETLGINYVGLQMDGLELHTNSSSTPEGYFTVGNTALMISYGKSVLDNLNLGIAAKYGQRKVYDSEDGFLTFDLGYLLKFDNLLFGGNVKNIFTQKFGAASDDKFDLDADVGVSIRFDKLVIGLDVARILRGGPSYYAGAEYSVVELNDSIGLKLRGGMNANNDISIGLGVNMVPINLDYAYVVKATGQEHVFSAGIQFDDNAKRIKKMKALEMYKEALLVLGKRNLPAAIKVINNGLKIDSDSIELRSLITRIDQTSKYMDAKDLNFNKPNYATLYNDGLYAYILRDNEKSLENTEYLILKTNNQKIKDLRSMIEFNEKKICKYRDKDVVGAYFEESLASLMVDKLEEANALLEKILYLEPNNILALKRLGSNYYVYGNKEKAVSLWKKVLTIAPNDEEVKKLIATKK